MVIIDDRPSDTHGGWFGGSTTIRNPYLRLQRMKCPPHHFPSHNCVPHTCPTQLCVGHVCGTCVWDICVCQNVLLDSKLFFLELTEADMFKLAVNLLRKMVMTLR